MAKSVKIIVGNKYVVPHALKYNDLSWYERDFIQYIDHLKYQEMMGNPTNYFFAKESNQL